MEEENETHPSSRGGKEDRHTIFASFIATTLLIGREGDGLVLDVAGGKGHLSSALLDSGLEVVLVDPCAGRGRPGWQSIETIEEEMRRQLQEESIENDAGISIEKSEMSPSNGRHPIKDASPARDMSGITLESAEDGVLVAETTLKGLLDSHPDLVRDAKVPTTGDHSSRPI